MSNLILLDDLGMRFPKENSKQKFRYGLYKCYCGNEFETMTSNVKRGNTKSCGCGEGNKKHNLANHRLYQTWYDMIRRCTIPKSNRYFDYGGRGITVCDRWKNQKNFIEDMYPTFKEGLSLDRTNVNGNYEPNNCRWATKEIQARNTRVLQKNNSTGYRGIIFVKSRNSFRVQIRLNSKLINLGYFDNALEAAKAYDQYVINNNLEHTINGVYK